MALYQLCVTVDADTTVEPPWVTIRLVEGGRHHGGMTQTRFDWLPPFQVGLVSDLAAELEERVLRHLSSLDGVQLEL
jgi:hypothetical protein